MLPSEAPAVPAAVMSGHQPHVQSSRRLDVAKPFLPPGARVSSNQALDVDCGAWIRAARASQASFVSCTPMLNALACFFDDSFTAVSGGHPESSLSVRE